MENKEYYILCKDDANNWGVSFKHDTYRGFLATETEAITKRDEARKRGRMKYQLYKLELIENE